MTAVNHIERAGTVARELLCAIEPIEQAVAQLGPTDELYGRLAAAIDDCVAKLTALNLPGIENRLPSSEVWNVAGHFLSRGWLLNQARTKPRGYAGDHDMLSRIYENRLCDDPLGHLLDRYFQSQAAPQAVRNRMAMMNGWIIEATQPTTTTHDLQLTTHSALRISVVGSAFGSEIRDALLRLDEATRQRLSVILLDLDPAAIELGQRQLLPLIAATHLIAKSTNLFRLPDRPLLAEPLTGSDLIFCPGLFDYLDDAAATAMLRCLYQQLAVGGRLIVFQFAPHNPTRTYMEWFGNWYLIYRDLPAFRRLVDSAKLLSASVTFAAEPLGIDLFTSITKGKLS